MVERVPPSRRPFLEPARQAHGAPTVDREPPVALLAELAWSFDRQRLADELRALTPNERSAVLRMSEDLWEAAEKSMQGDR